MGLRIMILSPLVGRTARVEIAQAHDAHPALWSHFGQQPLELPLRLTVRIDRRLRRVLRNRNLGRMTIDGARRRKDKPAYSRLYGQLQQYTGSRHVVGHIHLGLGHGFGDQGVGRQVDDRLDALLIQQSLEQLAVPHPALNE